MAAPIAHIFLAIQMLAGPLSGLFNEKEFIIGTSFPDIRYLGVISRNVTHFSGVTIEDIMQEKDSFKAGMLFHSLVDRLREEYIVAHRFYSKIPDFKLITQTLKYAEDEILRSIFDSTVYVDYFDDILEQEKAYNISEKDIRTWHKYLQTYFAGRFSCTELMMHYFDLVQPDAWRIKRWLVSWFYVQKMEHVIVFIVNNRWAKRTILDFYMNFAEKL